MMALRISPSLELMETIEPLASTKPAGGREVADRVLHPREVSVACARHDVLPALVLAAGTRRASHSR